VTRVALLHPFCWPDVRRGGERYLHDLGWYLSTQGVDVDIVVGGVGRVRGRRFERRDGVRVVRLRHPQRLDVRGLTRTDTFGAPAAAWLARHRYEVVHALTPTAALASAATGHRTVYTALGHPTRTSLGRRRWDLAFFTAAVTHASAAAALSTSAATSIAESTGVRPDVLPPGVRVDAFPANPAPRTGPPRVLFAADATDRRKGLDLLLRAFADVLAHRPDARLLIAGGGDAGWAFGSLPPDVRATVWAACDDLGVGDEDELPHRYADATVTVLPSTDEAFGLVLVESMAAGTPVVALATGGPLDIVDTDEVGRLAPPADPPALAAAIDDAITLAARPETATACTAHARRWDWREAIGPAHLDVYRRVARRWS
jgi:phosphatidyl-myo-inositol alpha-mannosyltransferase